MYSGVFDLPWWGLIIVTLVLTHITIAGVTIFLHRHQAHRALDLGPIPSHFFRCWLWLTTGMITKEWAAIHRKHHAKCETAEDPHSPQVFGIHRVLWLGVFLYVKEAYNRETIERYGHGTPDDWLERHVYSPWHKLGVVIMAVIDITLFGLAPGALVWAVQMAWIPFWAAGVINGVGHFVGYRNFDCADASTNIFPLGILIGGEELHNNHHTYATSARLSNKWYEFDIGWFYIQILAALGQADVKKVAPKAKLGTPRTTIDLETLQAVVTHRYDVLARYIQSARHVAADEISKLRLSAGERRLVRRMLTRANARSVARLSPALRERWAQIVTRSEPLRKIQSLRTELEQVWARSSATQEQLVGQLQDWVARAEASGIRQIEDFCLSLRRYAV